MTRRREFGDEVELPVDIAGNPVWSLTLRRRKSEYATIAGAMAVRVCAVSFVDRSGIRHTAEVEAESLFEAAVLGIRRLNDDVWTERIGPGTALDIDVREPATRHTITRQQVERWLAGVTPNPSEASRKAKLKMMLVQG